MIQERIISNEGKIARGRESIYKQLYLCEINLITNQSCLWNEHFKTCIVDS
jgi:hypothetical protein